MMSVQLPVIETLPGLPYSESRAEFLMHVQTCAPCAETHASRTEDPGDYCPEGSALCLAVGYAIGQQHAVSTWN